MNRLEKVLKAATTHTTCGCNGMSRSSDSRLESGCRGPAARAHQPGAALRGRLGVQWK
jgi:hypothetical protein